MDTTVFINSTVVEWAKQNVVFVKINGEDTSGVRHNHTPFADSFGLKAYPTFILLRSDGSEIDRAVGYLDTTQFMATFTDFLADRNTLRDYLRRLASDSSALNHSLVAEKYRWSGRSQEAEKHLRAAHALDTSAAGAIRKDAMMALADVARRDRNYDSAITRYQAFIAAFSTIDEAADAMVMLASCQAKHGKNAQALATYREYLSKYPAGADAEYVKDQIALFEKPKSPFEMH